MIYKKPIGASFLISEDCNLRCTYCFEKTKNKTHMSEETGVAALHMLESNLLYNRAHNIQDDKALNIMLFGGEPLLNFKTIKAIMEEGKKITAASVGYQIITNGTILTQEMLDYFKDFVQTGGAFNVQLSIDGIKETNDQYRIYPDGSGSFDTIAKNIPKFKEIFGGENFTQTNNRHRLHLHGSLNKKTVASMYSTWKYFNEVFNLPTIWFMPIHDEEWTPDDVTVYEEQLALIANDLLNKAFKYHDKKFIDDFAPLNKCLSGYFSTLGPFCGAGDTFVSVAANGDIYPCHQFYYQENPSLTKLGTVATGIDDTRRKLYTAYDYTDSNCYKAGCTNYHCYRCPAENYRQLGSIFNCYIGERCKMSSIEKKYIEKMAAILKAGGL